MDAAKKDQLQAGTGILLIFALGFVAGALALNLYRTYHPASPPRGGGPHMHHLEQTMDSLNLTEDQRTQIKQIFADTRKQLMGIREQSRPQVEEIRKQARERLKGVMSPDQFNQFQQAMKAEWEGHGGQHGPRHGDHPGDHSGLDHPGDPGVDSQGSDHPQQ